jgi:DNA-binding HxlR family transcriptional regulator
MAKAPIMPKVSEIEDHTSCPIHELLTRLGDKWSMLVIVALAQADGNRARFSELMRTVNGISQRMLTTTLRQLERDGMLTRHLFPEVPPRVEYALTNHGLSLLEPVQSMVTWVEKNWPAIQGARKTYDERKQKSA